jgi:hypothetical protein
MSIQIIENIYDLLQVGHDGIDVAKVATINIDSNNNNYTVYHKVNLSNDKINEIKKNIIKKYNNVDKIITIPEK